MERSLLPGAILISISFPLISLAHSQFALAPQSILSGQQPLGTKAMFYDPGDLGTTTRPLEAGLRPIAYARPYYHCGIHYWLESESGKPMTERMAVMAGGRFKVKLRNNIDAGLMQVFDLRGKRELTPRDGDNFFRMPKGVYTVPGDYEFSSDAAPSRLAIFWVRSATELAVSEAWAPERLSTMSGWTRNGQPLIVREIEESVPGEVGTYVMNRGTGGVGLEIVFSSKKRWSRLALLHPLDREKAEKYGL